MKPTTRLSILQALLVALAIGAAYKANKHARLEDAGASGAALGAAVIAAVCIACIAWIEVSIYRKS